MNPELFQIISNSFSKEIGEVKLKADESRNLLLRALYLLENLIIENNSNNLNAIKRLYEDIKELIVNK